MLETYAKQPLWLRTEPNGAPEGRPLAVLQTDVGRLAPSDETTAFTRPLPQMSGARDGPWIHERAALAVKSCRMKYTAGTSRNGAESGCLVYST